MGGIMACSPRIAVAREGWRKRERAALAWHLGALLMRAWRGAHRAIVISAAAPVRHGEEGDKAARSKRRPLWLAHGEYLANGCGRCVKALYQQCKQWPSYLSIA